MYLLPFRQDTCLRKQPFSSVVPVFFTGLFMRIELKKKKEQAKSFETRPPGERRRQRPSKRFITGKKKVLAHIVGCVLSGPCVRATLPDIGCYPAGRLAKTARCNGSSIAWLDWAGLWVKNGKKRIVWRYINRLDYGSKYCKGSPKFFLGDYKKHAAIAKAIVHRLLPGLRGSVHAAGR